MDQGYVATTPKTEAPANKAIDLNTAAAWLFSTPIHELPAQISSAAAAVHTALEADQIQTIQFWYVHNCRESQNVRDELARVESTVKAAVKSHFRPATSRIIGRWRSAKADWKTGTSRSRRDPCDRFFRDPVARRLRRERRRLASLCHFN